VRQALLRAAQANFQRILKDADNGYSKQLRQRGDEFTRSMQRQSGSSKSGAVLLDPNEFMAGLAIGMTYKEVATALLDAHHVPHTDKVVDNVIDDMRMTYRFPYTDANTPEASTQNPHAFADILTNDPRVCAIVPASAFYPPELQVPGMTHQQNIDFINRHESWHCRDDRNKIVGFTQEQLDKMEDEDPQMAIGDPARLQAYATGNRQESLADVGSAGDLIRKGADPKIIDGIITWRADASDTVHMTIGALQELKHRIDDMGINKFRKLSDDQARALYNDCAEKGAMSPATAEKIISYMTSSDEVREAQREQAKNDPDMQRALDYMAPYKIPPKDQKTDGVRPLTPGEQAVAEQVRSYDAEKMLEDRAFRDARKITPATIVKAYGELQDDLRRKMDKDPGNPLYQAQAVKLQESFLHVTNSLDYVKANADRGVNIVREEGPAMSRFATPSSNASEPEVKRPKHRHDNNPRIGDATQGTPETQTTPGLATTSLRAPARPTPGM
jgi:hypothetical protein